nr:unnamed protein product [Callosobruchus analis]
MDFSYMVSDKNFDAIAVSETWLYHLISVEMLLIYLDTHFTSKIGMSEAEV